MVADWILKENFHAFLDVLAGFADYELDGLDRDAVDAQLAPIAGQAESSGSYEFGQIQIEFAHEHGGSAVDVRVAGPPDLELKASGAIAALQLTQLRADRI